MMEGGLRESNSFLGHCCHRGEHFNPLPKGEGGDGRAGERAGRPRRGGLGAPRLTLRGPRRSPPLSADAGPELHCAARTIAAVTYLRSLGSLEVSTGRGVGFLKEPCKLPSRFQLLSELQK